MGEEGRINTSESASVCPETGRAHSNQGGGLTVPAGLQGQPCSKASLSILSGILELGAILNIFLI